MYNLKHILPTDVEQARLEFVKTHPEAIRRSSTSARVAVCLRCEKEIPLSDECLRRTTVTRLYSYREFDFSRASCPHCNAIPGFVVRQARLIDYSLTEEVHPIDHVILRVTTHWIREKSGFFRRIPEDVIREITVIEKTVAGRREFM